jgi:uncharacterized protein YihD (DUF1040 family)
MSAIKFVVLKGKSEEITQGVFLKDGDPFAYGHFAKVEDSLSMAFRPGDRENYELEDLIRAVLDATGLIKGAHAQFVTENNGIVDSIVAKYERQLQLQYSYRSDTKITITGREFKLIQQALADNEIVAQIHKRNIDSEVAVPTYLLEYEKQKGPVLV